MNFDKVIPLLVYRDIQSAHDFLVNIFGFQPGLVHLAPDGEAVHREIYIGSTTIWLHRITAEHELASPCSVDMAGAGMVIYVNDVDAHYSRTHASGAHIESEPVDQPYGQREYGVRDIEGHRWWFATLIPIPKAS